MKQVFNYSEVAHIWAAQSQQSARNQGNNFYFEGKTIFSYGRHFPIATIMEDKTVLFTLLSYSNTTAKHIRLTESAVSHLDKIYCAEVPIYLPVSQHIHDKNITHWKGNISNLFNQLGNKKIRDIQGRINAIEHEKSQLNKYCQYFKIKIKDAELKKLLTQSEKPEFVDIARKAVANKDKILAAKMKKAAKAYETKYLPLWRAYDNEGLKELPQSVKDLCNYYHTQNTGFTRLRFNQELNRLETSKGVQIPAEIAHKAFISLNGCFEGVCNSLNIPVMGYTITETTEKAIIAGCHTIPKEDVKYIADLLNW